MFKKYIGYLKDNPKGYWFKAKLYGWGWVPVTWQGWLVLVVSLAILAVGIYIGEMYDSPEAPLFGATVMTVIIFTFGFWKGEKPRWQWGPPKDQLPK